jgi:hypothetical protein
MNSIKVISFPSVLLLYVSFPKKVSRRHDALTETLFSLKQKKSMPISHLRSKHGELPKTIKSCLNQKNKKGGEGPFKNTGFTDASFSDQSRCFFVLYRVLLLRKI